MIARCTKKIADASTSHSLPPDHLCWFLLVSAKIHVHAGQTRGIYVHSDNAEGVAYRYNVAMEVRCGIPSLLDVFICDDDDDDEDDGDDDGGHRRDFIV